MARFKLKDSFMRPVIALTCSDNQSKTSLWMAKLAVWLAGGRPTVLFPSHNASFYAYQGLLLLGGVDINPGRYGKTPKTGYQYEDDRDKFELNHLDYAEHNNLPVLGICRGAQMINVYRLGTLHLDIQKAYEKSQYPSNIMGYIFFRKRIYVKPRSFLYRLLNKRQLKVNSLHRQSIDQIGRGLKATAFETNGIIQCIEDQDRAFFLGVQFHPEFLLYRKRFRRLFKQLVKCAKAVK